VCERLAAPQFGQSVVCEALIAWCERRRRVRPGEQRNGGTMIAFLLSRGIAASPDRASVGRRGKGQSRETRATVKVRLCEACRAAR
jgi:hypothetical protein